MPDTVAPRLIAIAGGSGAGKTTIARALAAALGDAAVVPLDRYYRDQTHLPLWERTQLNFDHPDALEFALLESHLESILAGRAIDVPRYDFNSHARVAGTDRVEPRRFVILEGLHTLHRESIRVRAHRRVFVDTALEVCLARRIARDRRERGRNEAVVRAQFETTVVAMYEQFVEPCRRWADVTVDGSLALGPLVAGLVDSLGG
jgi:uridine kinase